MMRPQIQRNFQEETTEAVRLQEFMEAAYKRVNLALQTCLSNFKSGQQDFENDFLKLNLLVDNTFIQFQSVQQKFPKSLQSSFQQTVTKIKQQFEKFFNEIPDECKHFLNIPLTRVKTVLDLKAIKLTGLLSQV